MKKHLNMTTKYGLNNELLSLLMEFPNKEWNYTYYQEIQILQWKM